MSNAKFIVIEGLEGAGKSTALSAVKSFLESKGVQDVVTCREPGGTPMGEAIRSIVKDNSIDEKVDSKTELLLMYASRIQLVENVIKPALDEGKWVVCDRFFYSTFAYQGGGRQISNELIESIHQAAIGDFIPDLTIYMDIAPEVGLSRARGRGELDRFEVEAIDFFNRTREMYLRLNDQRDEMVSVDAGGSVDEVRAQVLKVLEGVVV